MRYFKWTTLLIFPLLTACWLIREKTEIPEPEIQAETIHSDTFKIIGHRDTMLQTPEGIMLFVPAASFATGDSAICEDTFMLITTVPADIVNATDSIVIGRETEGDKMKGSIHLQAMCGTARLYLGKGRNLVLRFPRFHPDEMAQLFYGLATNPAQINWKLDSQSFRIPRFWLNGWKGLGFEQNWQRSWEPFSFVGSSNVLFQDELQWQFKLQKWDPPQGNYLTEMRITVEGKLENLSLLKWEEKSSAFQKVNRSEELHWFRFFNSLPALDPYLQEATPIEAHCQWLFSVAPNPPEGDSFAGISIELDSLALDFLNHTEVDYHIFNINRMGWMGYRSTGEMLL